MSTSYYALKKSKVPYVTQHIRNVSQTKPTVSGSDRRGPVLTIEPEPQVEFMNSTGAAIACTAQGHPLPHISWIKKDGSPAHDVEGLRHVRADGTLVFAPFRAEDYRQDVHAAVYRCVARNVVGAVASRDVNIRAGRKSDAYEA
ncbi:hypothetical protein JTE90_002746 [Oedothorax gibbosus]|uniref:Ig-like domain-containing protein n=1 Tax=Oedothorax gibbosus TaxID=931172 RepID=A0AAV6VY13_9ARAC|nr:hypothetical protein JTE90_002746 [Oedothorax gibbosus]